MSHTKGEFSVKRIGSKLFIIDDKNFTVTKVRYCKEAEANAKELVRRWNAFEKDGIVDELVEALGYYIDDGKCRFDHHGCCQTHGGDPCREANAKAAIAKCS